MKLICKLDPQPDQYGIFSTGSVRINSVDENGYYIHDPNWDLKPFGGSSIVGVWLSELACVSAKDGDEECLKQGRFVKAPDEIDFISLMSGLAGVEQINGEWWWWITENTVLEE